MKRVLARPELSLRLVLLGTVAGEALADYAAVAALQTVQTDYLTIESAKPRLEIMRQAR